MLIGVFHNIGMYIPLSDDELRFVQKVHSARANGHCLRQCKCNPLLLHYHIPQLYFVSNHLIGLFTERHPGLYLFHVPSEQTVARSVSLTIENRPSWVCTCHRNPCIGRSRGVSGAHPLRTQFLHFCVHFYRKIPAFEVDAPQWVDAPREILDLPLPGWSGGQVWPIQSMILHLVSMVKDTNGPTVLVQRAPEQVRP